MNLREMLLQDYNIGSVIKIEETENGSGNTYIIETTLGKYILKLNERTDYINIYDKVQRELNNRSLLQSKLIKTKSGMLLALGHIALYEYINGDSHKTLSKTQIKNAIRYMKDYNAALKLVQFDEKELKLKNHWDKAKSIDFILNEFPGYLKESNLEDENKRNIYHSIRILADSCQELSRLDKQLTHGDLGPDNFIFKGDGVLSIIDFTPEYNHELYSLCQFIYWNYLWINERLDEKEIKKYLAIYNLDNSKDIEIDIFYLLLIRAALFRIVGPLIEIDRSENKNYDVLNKRLTILDNILKVFKQGGCTWEK